MPKILFIIALAFSSITLSFAKSKVDYKHCQEAVNNLFQIEKISGNKTPAVFEIAEDGSLVANDKYTVLSKYNEETGEYIFRTRAKEKKGFSLFNKADSQPIKLYSYIAKKDSEGRLHSLEAQGECEECKTKLEIAYSKNNCVAKRVYQVDEQKAALVSADLETCKSLRELQKDLFKKMKKANKCQNELNQYYKESADIADIMLTKINEKPEFAESLKEGSLVGQLQSIKDGAKDLKEKDAEASEREEGQMELHDNFNQLLGNCIATFDKQALKTNKIYKDKKGLYEIKKENIGDKVDNPLKNLNIVTEE
jgi:hypothetical protein